MRQRITYEIRGQIERNCFFRVGTAMLRVVFSGGAVNSAGVVPAQYMTDNPLHQRAIENSADFRNGIITRGAVVDMDDAPVVMQDAACDDDKHEGENIYPDVTNTQQARAVLMGQPYKCQLSQLQNKHCVRAKADELGVSFPNWI